MSTTRPGYSAQVQIQLIVAGETLSVSHVGDGTLILREPRDLEPTDARLIVTVDGEEYPYGVRLDHGIRAEDSVVPFTKVEEPLPF